MYFIWFQKSKHDIGLKNYPCKDGKSSVNKTKVSETNGRIR